MKQTLSGCLKSLILALLLLVNVAYGATDLSRAENYFPGGKYQLFSYPDRGSVTNVVNNIHKRVINDEAIGPIHYQHVSYNGTLTYDRRFSGHPWWDHDYGPLGATTQEIDPFNGGIGFKGGIDVIKAKITAEIYHPADAYDGEQGGGLPPPSDKGARDEYTYSVTGKVRSVDVQPLDISKKVNDIVNRVKDGYDSGAYTDAENRQPEDNSADNDRRRDLHSDGQPENGQPEKADNGSWEDAEVKPPVDVGAAELATAIGGSATDILSSIAGSGRNSLKSDDAAIPSAIASGDVDYISTALNISPAEARALREAAGKTDDLAGAGSGFNRNRPSNFRKSTVTDAWDNAKNGSQPNTKQCPTCGKDVKGNPHNNESRNTSEGWDVSHNPSWSNRPQNHQSRKDLINDYNSKTGLECRNCNRSGGNNDSRFQK